MTRSWLIGRGADCDLKVDRPTVSVHHCRLTREAGGVVVLEDLGAPEGTFVNGVRLTGPIRVTPGDAVTLGPNTPLPWPDGAIPPGWTIFRIGREPDNDFPVNLGTVSGYHARIVWNGRTGQAIVEDLGSSNGTALGSPDRKLTRAALAATDTVFLGTHPIPAAVLLARVTQAPLSSPPLTFRGREMIVGRDPSCDQVVDLPVVSGRHARLARSGDLIVIEDLGSSNGTYVNGQRVDRPLVVAAGDRIRLGTHTLALVVEAGERRPSGLGRRRLDLASRRLPRNTPGLATPRGVCWPLRGSCRSSPSSIWGISALVGHRDRRGESDRSDVRPATGLEKRSVEPLSPHVETPIGRVATATPVTPVAPSPPSPTADLPSKNSENPPAPVVSRPVVKKHAHAAKKPAEAVKPPSDQPPKDVIAWANSLDLSNLKPEDENRLGDELHQVVLAHLKPVEEGPWMERAADVARRVSDAEFTITILDSNAVDAFSLPGGHIYLCRGLFDIIGTDEDYILEFAIGHEIAHLTQKHAIKFVAANAVEAKKRGVDPLNQFLVPIALGYRNALEFEADAWIYRRMIVQPDNTKRMCLAFLRKLRDYADRQKFANGRKQPDQEFPLFENHYRAHPAARERLKRLESYSAEAGANHAK